MKKEALKKLMITIFWFVIIIIVAIVFTKQNLIRGNDLFDLNLPFAIFAILVTFWEDKNKLFQKSWMRYLYIVLVGSYILSVAILYFVNSNLVLMINDLIALSILIVLSGSLVSRLFHNQISSDVKLLRKTAEKKMKSNTNLASMVDETFKEIKIWISKNKSYKKSDFKQIVNVSEAIFEEVLKNEVEWSPNKQEVDLNKIGENYIELFEFGIINKNESVVLESMCRIRKMAYSVGYYELLDITNETIIKCVDILFSLGSEYSHRQSIFMQELFNSINENIEYKKNEKLNDLVVELTNNILDLYRKHNYNLNENVFIMTLQGYGNTIRTLETNGINFNILDSIKRMIYLLNYGYKNKDLELFYIVRIASLLDNLESPKERIERISLLFDIINVNEYEKFALIYLVSQAREIIISSEDVDIQIIESYVNMVFNLSDKKMLHPEFDFVYDYLQNVSDEEFKEFVRNTLSPRNEHNENIEFIFRTILQYANENTLDFSTKLLIQFIDNTSFINFEGDYSLLRQTFFSITALTTRKYSTNTKKMTEQVSNIFEALFDLGKVIPNNNFGSSVISILNYFDTSESLEDLITKNLLKFGYNAVEANETDTIVGVSNSIGWIINRMIKDIVHEDAKKIEKIKYRIKVSVNFFKVVCNFSDRNNSIFVGTLFVVNMTQLKAYEKNLSNEKLKRSQMIYKEFIMRLEKSLENDEIDILVKSCELRKNLIEDFVESVDPSPKELVNLVMKDICDLKK